MIENNHLDGLPTLPATKEELRHKKLDLHCKPKSCPTLKRLEEPILFLEEQR